jgi:hypothetical protein
MTNVAGCTEQVDDRHTGPILAATSWRSNAELIADCAALGYLRANWLTLDPTYGLVSRKVDPL